MLETILNKANAKTVAINLESSDATEKSSLKRMEKLYGLVVLRVRAIIVKAFNFCQQMLSPIRCVKWDNVVDTTCFAKGWFSIKDIASTVACR